MSTPSSRQAEGTPTRRVHLAFQAADRAQVEAFYHAGLAAGGTDHGGPGLRPYLSARSATPYLDWPLAQADLGHLSEYAAVVRTAQRSTPPFRFVT